MKLTFRTTLSFGLQARLCALPIIRPAIPTQTPLERALEALYELSFLLGSRLLLWPALVAIRASPDNDGGRGVRGESVVLPAQLLIEAIMPALNSRWPLAFYVG